MLAPLGMLQGARILVADDDRGMLECVAEALEARGAEVVRAETGAALIEQLADEGPFGLIVTDVAMPWMSGLQAIASARYAGLPTPLIVMTASADPRIADDVRALGEDVVLLRKPFGLATLLSAAERLVAPAGSSLAPKEAAEP